MITNFDILADRLKGITIGGKELTAQEFINQVKAEEEVSIEASKLNLLSDTQIDELKQTVSKDSAGASFVDGMKTGVERLVKTIKNKKGLEAEGKIKLGEDGKIDFDATADFVTTTFETRVLADAKIEPEKRITKLELALQEKERSLTKVQKAYETDKSMWEEEKKQNAQKLTQEKADNYMFQEMPESEFLTKKQQLTLLKADGFGVSFDESGSAIPVLNGSPIKDKMEKARLFKDVVTDYSLKNKWIKNSEGREIGDESSQSKKIFKNKTEAFKHMEKHNIDPRTQEGKDILNKVEQE